ncbi:MAG: DUF4012 domain-containing protein [Actinomycetota bacterium]
MGVLVLLVALSALSLIPALGARDELEAGQAELVRARDLLLADDAAGAAQAFEEARLTFERAAGDAGHPLLRLEGLLPFVGRTPDAVRALAGIGVRGATAGRDLARAIADLPGGLSSLAPRDGRLPIEALAALGPAVSHVSALLEEAWAEALELPGSFVLGPVADAAATVRAELDDVVSAARSAEALLEALPSFAGAEGARRYFVAAQSPAELRGTGGLVGAYAILVARDGRLTFGPFRDIATLRDVPVSEAPAPTPEFGEIYDRFGGAGFWRNLNMTPDAPAAASLIESLYLRVNGVRLDGTIFVNPQTLAELLEATGPVEAPVLSRTLTAGNAVRFLANRAYFAFDDAALRKQILGIAVAGVLDRFLAGGTDPGAAIRALVDAAAGGHLVLHSADPDVQAAFETADVAGELGAPSGDYLGVFASNATGTKVDYYVSREVRYEVSLGPDGTAASVATVAFTNDAPAGAPPGYALGPYPGTGLGVGDDLSFVSVYCGAFCELVGVTQDGRTAGVEAHEEGGYPMFATYLRVDAQSSRTLGYSLQTHGAWKGDDLDGTYGIRIQGQPTAPPTTTTLVVRVPEGMEIVEASDGMEFDGREATWRGETGRSRDFVVVFRKPFPDRTWSEIWDFLSKPVIRL